MSNTRIEHDAFGPVSIPVDRYWGAQTQRALAVFGSGREQFPACLVRAFGQQKLACLQANVRLGAVSTDLSNAIERAAQELIDGKFDDHFPLSVWQTGSGTQTNMNANEVIANRANELLGNELGSKSPVHPNDHVNRSQSSNDSFPTVMHLTTLLELRTRLLPALAKLRGELKVKATAWCDVDIRLLGSGPRCGLGELQVPDDGLTSSIMPGKRNPTIAEVLVQAAMQVIGNHTTITLAGASSTFELNVAKPVLIQNLLQSIDVLSDSVNIFSEKLIKGLDVNRAQLASNVENSLLMATVLNPLLGYDRVARITQKAAQEGLSPKDASVALGFMTAEQYDQQVKPETMI
jgi:fumarate hydratase class II